MAVDVNSKDHTGYERALGLSTGWAVFSYLIAGMLAYGAIGWLISRATHIAILFPVGMLFGLGVSLAYVIYRYGRAEARATGGKGGGGKSVYEGREWTGDR